MKSTNIIKENCRHKSEHFWEKPTVRITKTLIFLQLFISHTFGTKKIIRQKMNTVEILFQLTENEIGKILSL